MRIIIFFGKRDRQKTNWYYLCVSGNRTMFVWDTYFFVKSRKAKYLKRNFIIMIKYFDSNKTFYDGVLTCTVPVLIKFVEVIFICVIWWHLVYLSCAAFSSSEKSKASGGIKQRDDAYMRYNVLYTQSIRCVRDVISSSILAYCFAYRFIWMVSVSGNIDTCGVNADLCRM